MFYMTISYKLMHINMHKDNVNWFILFVAIIPKPYRVKIKKTTLSSPFKILLFCRFALNENIAIH